MFIGIPATYTLHSSRIHLKDDEYGFDKYNFIVCFYSQSGENKQNTKHLIKHAHK